MQNRAAEVLSKSYDHLHPAVVRAELNLGSVLIAAGRVREARERLQELRGRLIDCYGDSNGAVLGVNANLGAAYRQAGEFSAAREALEDVYSQVKPVLGAEHPSTLGVAADLALTLGEYEAPETGAEAIALGEHVVRGRTHSLGPSHPQTLHAMRYLARAASGHDDDLALRVGGEAARLSEEALGRDHPDTLRAYDELAATLERGDLIPQAEQLRARNIELLQANEGILGQTPPAVDNLAGALAAPDAFVEGDLAQLGMPMTAPEGPTEVLARPADAKLDPPRAIEPGERFAVEVYLGPFDPETGLGKGPVAVSVPAGVDSVVLDVWLVATRHFEILGQPVLTLPIDRERETSERCRFDLKVTMTPEEFPEDPELRALFSYQGWPSGEVRLPVPVVALEVP